MRHEYVIFSSSARLAGIPQYLDTRQVYGYLTLNEDAKRCELLIGAEIEEAIRHQPPLSDQSLLAASNAGSGDG